MCGMIEQSVPPVAAHNYISDNEKEIFKKGMKTHNKTNQRETRTNSAPSRLLHEFLALGNKYCLNIFF